jgi:hypothetical protein
MKRTVSEGGWRILGRARTMGRMQRIATSSPRRSRPCGAAMRIVVALLLLCISACQSPSSELRGLAARPPLDYAVLVTGGAWLQPTEASGAGTFATEDSADGATELPSDTEPIAVTEVISALQEGAVFRRVAGDDDAHRARVRELLASRRAEPALLDFLQDARDRGFDMLLVVEGLQDNAIDAQGVNGRWPVTMLTWLLLGIGVFIPDHTFESGVTLRVTLRDLETGGVLADTISSAGPIDLSLMERGSALGLVSSILVPPFWVPDDDGRVTRAVRDYTQRRLLLSLARELKSEPIRQRLRAVAVAALSLPREGVVAVDSREALSAVRIRAHAWLSDEAAAAFEQSLVASMRRQGDRYLYESALPEGVDPSRMRVQVLVATVAGSVASATFGSGDPP